MARATLANIIQQLRELAHAGTADWTLGTANFWDADQLQSVLERYRTDHYRVQLMPVQQYSGGLAVWRDYHSGLSNLEATDGGTAIFYLEDAIGNPVSSTLYTPDYLRGVVSFASNTGGSAYYLSGRSYDMNRAAADVWRRKASYYANRSTFSTDNMRVEAGALYQHALEMAESFEQRAQSGQVAQMYRSDVEF
ncbi:MAG: hypothetical protein HONDAALG_00990 [Gammaproteobacteria bacterium]|nr:hypothetical protein [Gammaproteobacteria bacterium]